MLPLVSIIITCFNREKTIGRAIESAIEQDYPNLEIVISDNQSTDKSWEIIKSHSSRDERIKCFQNDINLGMSANYKIAVEKLSSGDYFSFLNSDDEFVNPNFISEAVETVSNNPGTYIVKSGIVTQKNNKKYFFTYETEAVENGVQYLERVEFRDDLGMAGSFVHRQTFIDLKINYNNINFDYEMVAKVAMYGNIGFIKKVSYKFLWHSRNLSLNLFHKSNLPDLVAGYDSILAFYKQQTNYNTERSSAFEFQIKSYLFFMILKYAHIQQHNEFQLYQGVIKENNAIIAEKILNSSKWRKFKRRHPFPKLSRFAFKVLSYLPV